MPFSLHGIGVSRGYAIGRTYLLQRNQPEITEYTIPDAIIEDEVQRFLNGLDLARQQLREIRTRVPPSAANDISAFIDTHLLMLGDVSLTEAPINLIRSLKCNAEWALKVQRDLLVQVFEEMDDPYLRTRKDDVEHVVRRVQRILVTDDPAYLTEADYSELANSRLEGRIVVADDLTPADTILMQHQGVLAFVTEYGGPLSHTAILARSLGIPAVVGARNARSYLGNNEPVIVDGRQGVILVGLDERILRYYRHKQQEERRQQRELNKLKGKPAITRDGGTIRLYANIELPEDAAAVREHAHCRTDDEGRSADDGDQAQRVVGPGHAPLTQNGQPCGARSAAERVHDPHAVERPMKVDAGQSDHREPRGNNDRAERDESGHAMPVCSVDPDGQLRRPHRLHGDSVASATPSAEAPEWLPPNLQATFIKTGRHRYPARAQLISERPLGAPRIGGPHAQHVRQARVHRYRGTRTRRPRSHLVRAAVGDGPSPGRHRPVSAHDDRDDADDGRPC